MIDGKIATLLYTLLNNGHLGVLGFEMHAEVCQPIIVCQPRIKPAFARVSSKDKAEAGNAPVQRKQLPVPPLPTPSKTAAQSPVPKQAFSPPQQASVTGSAAPKSTVAAAPALPAMSAIPKLSQQSTTPAAALAVSTKASQGTTPATTGATRASGDVDESSIEKLVSETMETLEKDFQAALQSVRGMEALWPYLSPIKQPHSPQNAVCRCRVFWQLQAPECVGSCIADCLPHKYMHVIDSTQV